MSTAGKFTKLDRLGDGTYGVVYKAESNATGKAVALKRMNPAPEEDGVPATTIREIALLRKMDHVNVVKLIEAMFDPPKLTLVFEYCEWDLKKLMDSKGAPLSVEEIRHFLRQLCEGLAYCHANSIIHRDLKPQNLLIEDPMATLDEKKLPANNDALRTRDCTQLVLKIADFGLARIEAIPVKKYSHEAVTLWYRSPDVILGSTNYGLPVDMWSVGCIFAEMCSGNPMFNAKNDKDQLLRIFKILGSPTNVTWPSMEKYPGTRAFFSTNPELEAVQPRAFKEYANTHNLTRIGEEGLALMEAMLRYEPSQRITAAEALNHPFLRLPGPGRAISPANTLTAGAGRDGTQPSLDVGTGIAGVRRLSASRAEAYAANAAGGKNATDSVAADGKPKRSGSMAFSGDGGEKPDSAPTQ